MRILGSRGIVVGVAVVAMLTLNSYSASAGPSNNLTVRPRIAQAITTSATGAKQLLKEPHAADAGPAVRAMMEVQVQLDRAASQIEALPRGVPGSGLSGVVVDPKHDAMTVYWHATISAAATRTFANIRSGGIAVVVQTAPYTLGQLRAERDRITRSAMASESVSGAQVVSIGPKFDGSGLTVGVAGIAAASMAPQAKALFPALSSTVALDIQPARTLSTTYRYDDNGTWGGAYVERWNLNHTTFYDACTDGFGVHPNNAINYGMLIANHCGSGSFFNGTGSWIGDSEPGEDHNHDAQVIARDHVNGAFYDGPSIATGDTNVGWAVGGAERNHNGDLVCTGGAFSGSFCNFKVVATGQNLNVGGYGIIYNTLQATQQNGIPAVGNGDSGGPVYALPLPGDSTAHARGTISAVPSTAGTTCEGVPGGATRHCSPTFWYPDIMDELAGVDGGIGATIVTYPGG